MSGLFLQIVNMSISASYLILAVLALRLILRKVPKNLLIWLWALVAIRLALPISLESAPSQTKLQINFFVCSLAYSLA